MTTTTTTTPVTKHYALKNKIHGYTTVFTDHGADRDEIIVTVIRGPKTLSTTRMNRRDAREEWSAMRAHCTPVSV